MSFRLTGVNLQGRINGYVPVGPTDPFWSSVRFLGKMDGSNGGTTFVDSSTSARTITRNNVTTSTTQIKFGTASAFFNTFTEPNDPFLAISNTDGGLNLGSSDFTIETWVYPTLLGTERHIVGNYQWQTGYRGGWRIQFNTNNTMSFRCSTSTGGSPVTVFTTSTSVPDNQWTAICVTRSGNTITGFINGISRGSGTFSGSISIPTTWPNLVRIGVKPTDGGNFDDNYRGYIDEMRITVGVARYTANYTVTTEPFPTA